MAGRGGVIRPKLLGADLLDRLVKRVEQMADEIDRELTPAAAVATQVSRRTFDSERSGRPYIPARPGRPTTRGSFSQYIDWQPGVDGNGNGVVNIDVAAMEAAYPGRPWVWLINEIGTGASAFMERGEEGVGKGGGERRVKVKSQVGRAIPYGLVWGTKANGKFVPPGGGANQQLYPASTLTGVPVGRRPRIKISEEIKPKHFVRDGGEQGFRQFEQSALAAAYAAFDKRQFR